MKKRKKAGVTLFRPGNQDQMLDLAKFVVARPNSVDSRLLHLLFRPERSLEPLGPLAGPLDKPDADEKCC
jgi:hypothetical protein